MKDLKTINKEREGRNNLSQYKDLIETVSKVEYKKFSNLGLIDLSEVISLANYTVYYLVNNGRSKELYNDSYITKAIKWAIRNEVRRRYKWYSQKTKKDSQVHLTDEEAEAATNDIREAVYKTILSIEEMAEAENPTQIKDETKTPDEVVSFNEMSTAIKEAMKVLPQREHDLIEAKFFHEKKLRELSEDFNISPSRISRIIQSGLNKIRKELEKSNLI